jgi:hypothetical protein
LLWRAVRHAVDRRAALIALASTVAMSGVVAALSYLFMYRDALGRNTTAEFFAADRFTGGPLDLPSAIEHFVRGALAWNYPAGSPRLVLALAVVGFVVVALRRPLVALSLGLGLIGLMLASRFAGLPGTANRVSAPLVLLVCLLPPLAVAETVIVVLQHVRPVAAGALAGAALAVAAVAWWTPQHDEPPYRGLRGITADMAPIAASPYEDNVVITYHWMTKWSAHDLLVNGGTRHRRFVIVGEKRDLDVEYIALEQPVYTDVAGLVRRIAPPTAAVWCVVPYDVGPDAGTRACQLGPTGRERLVVNHGERGEITLWKPIA